MPYRDFLRHIVNVSLGRALGEKKIQPGAVDEIRKLLAAAEAKYGFSSYGGNPERLADYLSSRDFNLLVSAFKGAEALDVLLGILEEARREYESIPAVRERLDEVLSRLRSGSPPLSKSEQLAAAVKSALGVSEAAIEGGAVVVRLGSSVVKVVQEGDAITVEVTKIYRLKPGELGKLKELVGEGA